MEVEPETIGINGNSNGHGDANAIGPTVELVPGNGQHANGNGHASAPVNGNGANGHHDETPEPQQTLFSWAEFMAEEAGQAQGTQEQAPARDPLDVRVGDKHGAGKGGRAGRRGTLDRMDTGEAVAHGAAASPHTATKEDYKYQQGDEPMARIFVYDDREFPDPNPEMSVEQVKATLSDFYGEIANASVKETKRGDDNIFEFQRRVGTKGTFPCAQE